MRIVGPRLEILGVSSALPERVVGNDVIMRRFGDAEMSEKLTIMTGVVERRHASPGQTAADLGVQAAERLLQSAGIDRSSIDFLIMCTETPDHVIPATACIVQDRLGLPTSCAAFDVNLGCSGWVYSLTIAQGYLSAGIGRRGLVITADTLTRYLHP